MKDSLYSAVVKIFTEIDEKDLRKQVGKAADQAGQQMAKEFEEAGEKAGKRAGQEVAEGLETNVRKGAQEAGQHIETEMARASQRSSQSFEDSWKKTTRTMIGIGAAMTAGVTVPVLRAFGASRDAFSELEDARGAVQQVFGEAADELIRWTENVKDATGHYYGYSRGMALNAAAIFYPLIRSFADAGEQAEVTIGLLERAADMSAYAGTSVEEALEALRSGLSGQTMPLRRYGININQSALTAIAAREGIIDVTLKEREAIFKVEEAQRKLNEAIDEHGEASREAEKAAIDLAKAEEALANLNEGRGIVLTNAQQQEAAYIAIMEQGEFMMGQYGREADSLSGSMKELAAAKQRAAEAAGEAAAPAMIAYYEAQTKVWETIGGLPEEVQKLGAMLAGLGAAAGPIMGTVGALGELAFQLKLIHTLRGATAATGAGGLLGGIGKGGRVAAGAGGLLRGGGALLGKGALVAGAGLAAYHGTSWLLDRDPDGDGTTIGQSISNWWDNMFEGESMREAERSERRLAEADRRMRQSIRTQDRASTSAAPAAVGTTIGQLSITIPHAVDGDTIRRELEAIGVDMSHVRFTPGAN